MPSGDTSEQTPTDEGFRSRLRSDDWIFIRRMIIALSLIGLAYFLWLSARVLVLLFASILFAVLLRAFADLLARHTFIPRRWSLSVATTVIIGFVVGFLYLFGSQIAGQLSQVFQRLPDAINAAGDRFDFPNAMAQIEMALRAGADSSFLSHAAGVGYTVVGTLADVALVVVASIYLASEPDSYQQGVAKLLPTDQHDRMADAMAVSASALRLWLAGQLACMMVVGTASGLAYWWIGLPSPLALGIIAGATNFIPFLGPFLGAIPALVFASASGLEMLLWTAGAILVIQQIEGNILSPLIQKRVASLPPALALFAIVIFGLFFGVLGMFIAVPMAVVLFVLVNKLWVRQTLGQQTVVPGEKEAKASST